MLEGRGTGSVVAVGVMLLYVLSKTTRSPPVETFSAFAAYSSLEFS